MRNEKCAVCRETHTRGSAYLCINERRRTGRRGRGPNSNSMTRTTVTKKTKIQNKKTNQLGTI